MAADQYSAIEMSGDSGRGGCCHTGLPAEPLDSQKSPTKVKKLLRLSLPPRQDLWAEEGIAN